MSANKQELYSITNDRRKSVQQSLHSVWSAASLPLATASGDLWEILLINLAGRLTERFMISDPWPMKEWRERMYNYAFYKWLWCHMTYGCYRGSDFANYVGTVKKKKKWS